MNMNNDLPESSHDLNYPALEKAVELLLQGQLVAFPTETVYGLGGNACDDSAIASIYRVKGRPSQHPVIVHLAEETDPNVWTARLTPATQRLMEDLTARFWPGPLTLILPCSHKTSRALTGGQDAVGLRCPSHPVAHALLQMFAEASAEHEIAGRDVGSMWSALSQTMTGIAAPSANRFGHVSPTRAQHVRDEFGDEVFILDGGDCTVGIESTILDLTRIDTFGPMLLRPGSIMPAQLAEVIGALPSLPIGSMASNDTSTGEQGASPRVPGSLDSHYAPKTPLHLVDASELVKLSANDLEVAVWTRTCLLRNAHWLQAPNKAEAYAHDLYAVLRQLDALHLKTILIERPPQGHEWDAVRDRLQRAASPR